MKESKSHTFCFPFCEKSRRDFFRVSRVAALAWLLAGCAPPVDSTLRFGLPTAPATLDPRFATDANAARLCRLLYATLVDFDANFKPVPALAHWDALTPTHYRFRLRRPAQFHDGTPLTATDVAATYRAVLDPLRGSPHRGSLAHLARVEVIDPATIDFHLSRADPLLPGLLVIGILRATDAARDRLGERPIGSGPFKLYATPTSHRVPLERIADGQRIDFIVVPNETTRALKLARGELDLAQGGFAPELSLWLAQQPQITVKQRAGTVFTYLGLNLVTGPTADARIRRAIALAIDRGSLVQHVFKGQARLANAILVPEHWAGYPGLPGVPFDPDAARRLLGAAGYSLAHPLRLSYKTSNDHFRRRIAAILQHQLHVVGIELAIQTYDWGTFYGDIKQGRFELYGLSWVGLQQPDIFRHAFHSAAIPPDGANRGGYSNPIVDRLIEHAEVAPDEPSRAARYRQIQAVLQADLPYVPLWYEDSLVVHGPRVLGYDTDLHGQFDGLINVNRVATNVRPAP